MHQIQIILGGGIDIVGGVHILRAHITNQLCKILSDNTGSEGIVDGGNQLVIRLLRLKAADQPGHKSRLVGMVIQGKDVQHLSLPDTAGHIRIPQSGLDGVHVVLYLLKHLPVAVRHLLRDLLLKRANIQFQRPAEHGDDSSHGHEQGNDHNQNRHCRFLQRLFVRQQRNRYLFECRADGYAHHRPPAFPNSASL